MLSRLTAVVEEIAHGIYRVRDTCNVYVILAGDENTTPRTAIAVDFGSGVVLDHLDEMGVSAITDIVMTHHHRDQAQGLPRAIDAGIRVHVPPVEVGLFNRVEAMWEGRQVENDYDLRQDRFSILDSIDVDSTVLEYRAAEYGGVRIRTIPTPGHTIGSVTYLVDHGDERLAFTGDLIYAPGKVWSLAATQWSYTGSEGPVMTTMSCMLLEDEHPTMLLPSHGEPMTDAPSALKKLASNMQQYIDTRTTVRWDIHERLRNPFVRITDHLILNRSSNSRSFVVLSDTGSALFIDFGYDMVYDMMWALLGGRPREASRPWLASLPELKKQFGVTSVEVALPTHYHDDHVAGLNLLRDVEGTEVWTPANVAPILDDPMQNDLPCLWFEPIKSDRVLPLGEAFQWREYTITVHEQPGHTLYAAAFEIEIDGVRMLFTGDQQSNLGRKEGPPEIANYQYRNRFRIDDYRDSASLYQRIMPGLMLGAHWEARQVDPGFLEYLAEVGESVVANHHELLPLEELNLGADSVLARLTPYRSVAAKGSTIRYTATVKNPFGAEAEADLSLALPTNWRCTPNSRNIVLEAGEERAVEFSVTVGNESIRRGRVALDLSIGPLALGQHVEALVEIR
jgi:glyoxylase-like metal-dependent hydrolase (beta-lactamase superfamily II)